MQTVTFSATATAQADLVKVDVFGSGYYEGSPAGLRVFARSSANGAAATIELILVRKGVRLAVFPATVTATAYRADAAGTGGSYICKVEFTEGGTSKVDLLGLEMLNNTCDPGWNGDDAGAAWMIGCSSLGGLTALTLELAATTEV